MQQYLLWLRLKHLVPPVIQGDPDVKLLCIPFLDPFLIITVRDEKEN
jgi:hypothetical protein